jgi:micrococcal nuclease
MWGRFRRWPRVWPILTAICLVAVACVVWLREPPPQQDLLGSFGSVTSAPSAGPCEVVRVIDGDTFVARQTGNEQWPEFVGTIRLLGINTPETVKPKVAPQPFGPEATQFTKDKLASGQVRLQLDKRRLDRYGRFLAYVYVDDQHLGEMLVEAGLARVHTYPGDSMTVNRQLLRAQDIARREQRGIWSLPVSPPVAAED